MYATGNVKLYKHDGTEEATQKSVPWASGGISFQVKCTSGTGTVYFNKKGIEMFTITGNGANVPLFTFDFSNWTNIKTLNLAGKCSATSSLTKLTILEYLHTDTGNNRGVVTGELKSTVIVGISVVDYIPNRSPGAAMIITMDLSTVAEHCYFEIVDDAGNMTVTGDITDIDPTFFYGNVYENVSADISAWHACYYLENNCPNITGTTIVGMVACGYFQPHASVLTTAQVNQFLADLRANVATVKGYGPSEGQRSFDVSGAIGSGAPSGQGLIDKQFLIDWVGGEGQINLVTTR